jgi:hypothetical protein
VDSEKVWLKRKMTKAIVIAKNGKTFPDLILIVKTHRFTEKAV